MYALLRENDYQGNGFTAFLELYRIRLEERNSLTVFFVGFTLGLDPFSSHQFRLFWTFFLSESSKICLYPLPIYYSEMLHTPEKREWIFLSDHKSVDGSSLHAPPAENRKIIQGGSSVFRRLVGSVDLGRSGVSFWTLSREDVRVRPLLGVSISLRESHDSRLQHKCGTIEELRKQTLLDPKRFVLQLINSLEQIAFSF